MATIKQTAINKGATPSDIYGTLMDGRQHGALTAQPTKVSRRVGGTFKVGHDLEGKHLVLTKDKRITQTWRANNWPKGVYSKATFALAKTASGTKITFTQTGVPAPYLKENRARLKAYYWGPLKKKYA
jgi:activator of HSP90 ATPase